MPNTDRPSYRPEGWGTGSARRRVQKLDEWNRKETVRLLRNWTVVISLLGLLVLIVSTLVRR